MECQKNKGTAYQTLSEAKQKCSGKGQKQINKQIKTDGIRVNSRTLSGKSLNQPRPDLELVSVRYNVKRLGKNKQTQWIEVKVRNKGPAHIGISGHPPIQVTARGPHANSTVFSADRPITNLRAGLSKIVKINLPKPITRPEMWTVKVDSRNVIRETNETNNSSTTLIGKRARTDLPVAHIKKQIPVSPVGKIKGTSPKRNGAGNVPESVPKSLDSGITIISPTSADTIYMERPMNVRFRFTREVEAGEVTVYIKNKDTGAIVFTKRTSYHTARSAVYNQPHKTKGEMRDRRPLQEAELTLPGDLDTAQPYVVTVNKPASGVSGVSNVFYVRDFSIGSSFGMTAVEIRPETLSLEPGYGSYQPGEEVTVRIHSKKSLNYIYLSRSDTTMGFWPCLWRYEDGHQEYNSETGDHLVTVQLPDDDTGDRRWAITAFVGDSSSLSSHRFVIGYSMGARWPTTWEILIPSPLMSVTAGQMNVPFSWRLAGDFPEDRRESSDFRVILLKGDSMRVDLPRESIRWQHGYQFEWNVPESLPTGDDYRIQVMETNSGISATSTEFSVYSTISISYDATSPKVFSNWLDFSVEWSRIGRGIRLFLVDQHGDSVFEIGLKRILGSGSRYSWWIGSRLTSSSSAHYPVGYEGRIYSERFAIRAVSQEDPGQWAQGSFFTISRPYISAWIDSGRWCGARRGKTVHWVSNLDGSHKIAIDVLLVNNPDIYPMVMPGVHPSNSSTCIAFNQFGRYDRIIPADQENVLASFKVYSANVTMMTNAPEETRTYGISPSFTVPRRFFD